jgi:hypothetical protein
MGPYSPLQKVKQAGVLALHPSMPVCTLGVVALPPPRSPLVFFVTCAQLTLCVHACAHLSVCNGGGTGRLPPQESSWPRSPALP